MVKHTRYDDKAELIAQLDTARARFARSLAGLRREADVGARLKHSFSAHKTAWVGSAGVAGWLLSRLPRRKQKVIVHSEAGKEVKEIAASGLVLGILKTLFFLFRPVIMRLASKKIGEIAKKHNRWEK